MARKTALKMSCVLSASLSLAAAGISLNAQSAAANYKRPAVHRLHHAYATYRGPQFVAPRNAALWSGIRIPCPRAAERYQDAWLYVRTGCRDSRRVARPADECVRQPLSGRQVRLRLMA